MAPEHDPRAIEWRDSIEARRSALASNDRRIEVIDYGAGSATERRSAAEMRQGVAMTRTVARVCATSVSPFWGRFLYHLVLELEPRSCLELGTSVGISAAYQGAALTESGIGALRTLEGSASIATIAAETMKELSITTVEIVIGPFHSTLAAALTAGAPVDLFFNDGHHDREALLAYFETALPLLAPNAVVVFDDIAWSEGMRDAWKTVVRHPRVRISVDLGTKGVVLLDPSLQRRRFVIPID